MSDALRPVIVGAGPAGVRAAEALVDAGLRPVVIDENARWGGQIYRQPPVDGAFARGKRALYGFEAAKADAVHRTMAALLPQVDYRPNTLAWACGAGRVDTLQDGRETTVPFSHLIIASGAIVELVTIGTYISELVPKHIRGRAFACEQAVGVMAVPVVAFLAWLLVPRAPLGLDGWRWVVLIGAHGALFVWWIRRNLPESPRWLAQQGRVDEADRVMRALEAKVEAEYGRPLPPAADSPPSPYTC